MFPRFLSLFAALALVLGAPADAAPPDIEYHDGTFVVTEPLVVAPGATLSIENATVYLDFPTICPTKGSAGYCQPQITILAGGTLRVVNSTIDTHNWTPLNTDTAYAIVTLGGRIVAISSTFRHPRIIGGQGATATALIQGSTFTDGVHGLSLTRGMTGTIENSVFEDLRYGVAIHDGTSSLTSNVFRRITRDFGGGDFGRAIDIQATIVGEKAFENRSVITGNLVEDSHQALLSLNNDASSITDNVFRGNVIGTTIGAIVGDEVIRDALPLYTRNTLDGNETALSAYTSGLRQTPGAIELPIHGNAFLNTLCTEVVESSLPTGVVLTVNASDNWWGTPSGPVDRGPTCPATTGSVITSPWRTTPLD